MTRGNLGMWTVGLFSVVLSTAAASGREASAAPVVFIGGKAANGVAATAPGSEAPTPKSVVHRFALITGASQGGPGRVPLRFAASDARAIQHVLSDLGGLGDTETLMLLDVNRAGLRAGFDGLKKMVSASHAPDVRTEMIFYYSGHSDETGLLLGGDRVTYPEIRAWVDETAADVRIAVLDSCASGAMTRGKGGVHRPPFLVDTSSAARGHAYLTASAENEAAQESDRLGAAYFTHYLVSGLRGAADVSHDGRVTLSEAYQYAFTETLARTEASRGGPQHASYDFQLAGKGDLVMTDLRATSASLVLPPEMSGRLFVRDAQGLLIAEVHKIPTQPIELGLPPGRYRVTLDDNRRFSETTIDLGAGRQTTLVTSQLVALVPARGTAKGTTTGDVEVITSTSSAPVVLAPPRYVLNLSLLPPLDTNAGVASDNAIVVGILARSARFTGVSLTGLGHYVDGDARGLEIAGVGSVAQGDVSGVRITGMFDYAAGTLRGVQLSGFGADAGGGRGAQIAGAATYSRGDFRGLQLSGAANVARGELRGFQLSGALNIARHLTGGQLATVNIAEDVRGMQFGVVNVGKRVHGSQFGLVNVADSVDGASLGLITFVRDGIHAVDISSTEVGATTLSVLLGNRLIYTRLGIGVLGAGNDLPGGRTVQVGSAADAGHFLCQWGIGAHHVINDRWFVDAELAGTQYYRTDRWHQEDAVTGSLRLLVGIRLAGTLSAILGPTYSTAVGWNGTDLVTGTGFAERTNHDGSVTVRMYPGATIGLRI